MAGIVLAILASVGVGVGAERRWGHAAHDATRRVLDAMLYVLLPFAAFFSIAGLRITSGVGAGLLFGYAELAIVTTVAWLVGTRVLRLPRPSTGALMCGVALANTGYLGVPVAAAALGRGQVGPAIAFDAIVSGPMLYVVGFAIGATFGTRGEGAGAGARVRAFLTRNPPLLAVVAGLLAPSWLAPQGLVDLAHAIVIAMIVPGFFALGVNLMEEREDGVLAFPPPITRPLAVALVLRLLAAPALLLLAAALIVDVPDAYKLAAAAPSGINGLIVAHAYGLDLRLAAGTIAWSTAIFVTAALAVTVMT